jgi:hypothetical protein
MIRTLVANGFRPQVPVSPEAFADSEVREVWLRDKHMLAFSLVDQANPMRVVDLLLKPDVPFAELLARSEAVALNNTTVRIASIDDLIALKRHAGRPQDLADIGQLETIRRRKGNR